MPGPRHLQPHKPHMTSCITRVGIELEYATNYARQVLVDRRVALSKIIDMGHLDELRNLPSATLLQICCLKLCNIDNYRQLHFVTKSAPTDFPEHASPTCPATAGSKHCAANIAMHEKPNPDGKPSCCP